MLLYFYAIDGLEGRAWKFSCSEQWFKDHDNGKASTYGFSYPEDISMRQLIALRAIRVGYHGAIAVLPVRAKR